MLVRLAACLQSSTEVDNEPVSQSLEVQTRSPTAGYHGEKICEASNDVSRNSRVFVYKATQAVKVDFSQEGLGFIGEDSGQQLLQFL